MKWALIFLLVVLSLPSSLGATTAQTEQPVLAEPEQLREKPMPAFRASDETLTSRVVSAYSGIFLVLLVLGGLIYVARKKGVLPGLDPLVSGAIKLEALRQLSPHLKVAIVTADDKRYRVFFNQNTIQVVEAGEDEK